MSIQNRGPTCRTINIVKHRWILNHLKYCKTLAQISPWFGTGHVKARELNLQKSSCMWCLQLCSDAKLRGIRALQCPAWDLSGVAFLDTQNDHLKTMCTNSILIPMYDNSSYSYHINIISKDYPYIRSIVSEVWVNKILRQKKIPITTRGTLCVCVVIKVFLTSSATRLTRFLLH